MIDDGYNSLIEIMADIEHKRWSNWQKYLHSLCIENKDGSLTIPVDRVDHWKWEINAPYERLPDNLREYDRVEARKTLEAALKWMKETK